MSEHARGDRSPDEGDAAERLVRLGPRELTWPEVCARADVDHEVADVLWRALGFPDVPPDERAYTEDDVRALAIAAEGMGELERDRRQAAVEAIVREARMVSAHLTRVAEIEADAMAEMRTLGLRQRVLDQALRDGLEGSDMAWLLVYGLRRRTRPGRAPPRCREPRAARAGIPEAVLPCRYYRCDIKNGARGTCG